MLSASRLAPVRTGSSKNLASPKNHDSRKGAKNAKEKRDVCGYFYSLNADLQFHLFIRREAQSAWRTPGGQATERLVGEILIGGKNIASPVWQPQGSY